MKIKLKVDPEREIGRFEILEIRTKKYWFVGPPAVRVRYTYSGGETGTQWLPVNDVLVLKVTNFELEIDPQLFLAEMTNTVMTKSVSK